MLKDLKRSLCGDIGLVVLSGLGTRRTLPDGVGGALMARRPQFSPSTVCCIPAYIGHSMKLFYVHIRIFAASPRLQNVNKRII
jgi:hypothetical protein